jgi:iron complex transport system permease protein
MRAERGGRSGEWWHTGGQSAPPGDDAVAEPLPGLRPSARRAILGGLVLAVVVVALFASAWGSVRIPVETIARMVLHRLGLPGAGAVTWPASWETIIFTIRLPRVILAGIVGASLAISGATYQGLFRNPLADPYLIGVAAGAALGATVATVLRLPLPFYRYGAVQWCAFAGALLAVIAVYGMARVGGATPLTTLLLAGVAISALASAANSFLMYWHGDKLLAVYGWLLGGFTTASWAQILQIAPYLLLGALVMVPAARLLDALQLGEESAATLGIDVERLKLLLIVVATLVTAAAVSVSGLIGFVGLIVPHIVRLVWGAGHRLLLPASLLGGAIFLIVADGFARALLPIGEIPVGVLTALCGAPFFLFLLRRSKVGSF